MAIRLQMDCVVLNVGRADTLAMFVNVLLRTQKRTLANAHPTQFGSAGLWQHLWRSHTMSNHDVDVATRTWNDTQRNSRHSPFSPCPSVCSVQTEAKKSMTNYAPVKQLLAPHLAAIEPLADLVLSYWPVLGWQGWDGLPNAARPTTTRALCPAISAIELHFGLGCSAALQPPGVASTGLWLANRWVCFHPGYSMGPRGAFRIGDGSNCDMGWVPGPNVLHQWHVTLRRSGHHSLVITDGTAGSEADGDGGPQTFSYTWLEPLATLLHANGGLGALVCGGSPHVLAGPLEARCVLDWTLPLIVSN